MTLEKLVPSWLRKEHGDVDFIVKDDGTPLTNAEYQDIAAKQNAERLVPRIAKLPTVPDFSDADEEAMIYGKAAVQLHQHRQEVADLKKLVSDLRVELAEALLGHEGHHKKVAALELENIQLRNDMQTMQTQITEMRQLHSVTRGLWDRWEVKPPEKKRKPKRSSVVIEKVSKD